MAFQLLMILIDTVTHVKFYDEDHVYFFCDLVDKLMYKNLASTVLGNCHCLLPTRPKGSILTILWGFAVMHARLLLNSLKTELMQSFVS